MSTFIPSLNRAPGLLLSGSSSSNITRTQLEIFRENQKLSTGRDLLAPSDDTVRSAAVSELDARIEKSKQRQQNLGLTASSLAIADGALGEVTDLLGQARDLALDQLGFGSDADQRASQATVVNNIIEGVLRAANRESPVGHVFGGASPGTQPVRELNGAYLFAGQPGSLITDTSGLGRLPSTIEATNAVAATSSRVRGSVDLQPRLTPDTRLVDLRGAAGQGIGGGVVAFEFNGNPPVEVDLSGLDTIGDVADAIEAGIRAYEASSGSTVLDAGGVGVSGESISIDVAAGGTLTFTDRGSTTAGRDLGLVQVPADPFTDADALGAGVSPRLTARTPVASLGAVTPPLGSIRVTSNGVTADVDLSTATTVGDVAALIEGAVDGVDVRINREHDRLDVVSTLSGDASRALSIAEVPGGGATASSLGIRSFDDSTRLSDFNFGRGVSAVEGDPDPANNVDFTITLGDGFEIDIDLSSGDLATVGTARAAMNAQIDAALTAAARPATQLDAVLLDGENGLTLAQNGVTGAVTVERRNNSPLAQDLGLLDGAFDAGNNRLVGEDRAAVRVDSVFTHLIDLREALENDDTFGIQLATDRLNESIDRVSITRAEVGGYDRRVQGELSSQQNLQVTDEAIRSELFDVDFAASASRFSLLQTQLQAGLRSTGIAQSLTLLNFI